MPIQGGFEFTHDLVFPTLEQTFHGGHLEELANASVLFSAHRRGSRSGGTGLASNSGDISRSHSARVGERTTRDIFLGQVLYHRFLGFA